MQQIVAKTDGIPLFVEELVKTILESGLVREEAGRYLADRSVATSGYSHHLTGCPDGAPGSAGRRERGGAARRRAWGREFSYDLLRVVTTLEERAFQQSLAQLVATELLYPAGPSFRRQPTSLSTPWCRTPHTSHCSGALGSSTTSVLRRSWRSSFPKPPRPNPELLAHHYTEAGLSVLAIRYWQRAGQRAIQRSANIEAISHLTQGLEVLKTLPDTAEHTQQELALQVALGPALLVTKGHAALELEQPYTQARELCQQHGERPRVLPGAAGTVSILFSTGAVTDGT